MDIEGSFNDALNAVITLLPALLAFLVILFIGWLVAKAIRKLVNMILERVGFDRAVERGGIKRAMEQSKYDASGLVATLVYYAVLLIVLQLAFGVFGPNPVSDMLAGIVAWLPQAIVAVVIVVVAAAIANALFDLVGSALSGVNYGRLVARAVQVFVIALGVIAALEQIGVATAITTPVLITVLAIVAGVVIVGIGGGMLRPMEQRWERWLNRAEDEVSQLRGSHGEEAYQRGREDALRVQEAPAETGSQSGGEAGRIGTSEPAGYRQPPPPQDRQ